MKSKWQIQDGWSTDKVTSLLRHMKSQLHAMYLEGNCFRNAIFPQGFTVNASILSMLRGGRLKSPPPLVPVHLACVAGGRFSARVPECFCLAAEKHPYR